MLLSWPDEPWCSYYCRQSWTTDSVANSAFVSPPGDPSATFQASAYVADAILPVFQGRLHGLLMRPDLPYGEMAELTE